MSEYQYRNASKKDIGQLLALMHELGYEMDSADLLNRIEQIKTEGSKLVVAENNGEVVGVVHALVNIRLAEGKVGEIVSLVVKSNSRGKGGGKMLVTHAKEYLFASGCTSLRVRANVIREDAHKFYKAMGFRELKTQKVFVYEYV